MTRLVLAVIFLLAAGCGGQGVPRAPQERGRAAYISYNCRTCHQIGPEGGTVGPDLSYLGFRKSATFLDAWLKDPRAWQPSTKMPDFNLTPATRGDLVAYLSTLRGQAYARKKPWNEPALKDREILRGREIYERAGCSTCHGKEGTGGFRNNNVAGGKIPALLETASTFTRDELIRKIRVGVPKPQREDPTGPQPLLAMPAWGQVLADDEIAAVADYLLTLKSPHKDDW